MTKYDIVKAENYHFDKLLGVTLDVPFYAWAIYYENEIACVAGIKYENEQWVMFSNIRPKRYPATTVYKIACWIITRCLEKEENIIALGTKHSHNFLERLGLLYVGDDELGQRIYKVS